MTRPLVIVESPYGGEVERNAWYARACLYDSIRRHEAPFASHLLYPQVLAESVEAERNVGIACGCMWGARADLIAVYTDLGISPGMRAAIEHYETETDIRIEHRTIASIRETLDLITCPRNIRWQIIVAVSL